MIREAIILAGGMGTRLRDAVPGVPKCMAPVNGRPFISYVVRHLQEQGIEHFVFALGYKSEAFESFLQELNKDQYTLSIEDVPLGTGGAIHYACNLVKQDNVLVTNGDTLYRADIQATATFHTDQNAECTLALKPMHNFERYGVVEINDSGRIIAFKEKQYYEQGLINGGLYILNAKRFMGVVTAEQFSFEKDYLEKHYDTKRLYGFIQDSYFIDIGIPEDYERANRELGQGEK